MAQLTLAFQDAYLFEDTLRANIALGREDDTAALDPGDDHRR